MSGNPTIYDMSPECQAMVVKKVYEHYTMNITWREICQNFSTMCMFIFPSISYLASNNSTIQITVIIVSALVSLLVTFFCGTKKYYENLHIVIDAYTTDCNEKLFLEKYIKLLPYIREIDFARGRCDYTKYCEDHSITPNQKDVLTRHDIKEMNRQRLIIACLCFIVFSLCGLLLCFIKTLDSITKMILIFISVSTLIGFILMLVDCIEIPIKKRKLN